MGRCEPPSAIGSVEIRQLERDSVTVVVVGEQDQSNVASLRSALTLASAMADRVVVDLGRATFVSAALLGAVVSAEASLRRRGAALTVRSPSPMARRVFEMTALAALFDERSLVTAPRPGRRPSMFARCRRCGPASDDPGSMAAAVGAAR